MNQIRTLLGQYPWPLAWSDGRLGCVRLDRSEPPNLIIECEDVGLGDPVPTAAGCIGLRAAVSPDGVVCVVGHNNPDRAVCWLSGVGWFDCGPCTRTCIVRWDRDAFDLAIPYSGDHHWRIRLDQQGHQVGVALDVPNPPTGTGAERFDGDNVVFDWGHDHPTFYPYLCDTQTVNGVTVGLGPLDTMQAVVDGVRFTLYGQHNPRMPGVAGTSERFLATAWLDNGQAVIVECRPPYAPDPPIVVADPPLEPPVLAPIGVRLTACYPGNYGIQLDAPGNALMVATALDLDAVLWAGDHRLLIACGAAAVDVVAACWYRVYGVLVDGERNAAGEVGGEVRVNVMANAAAARARMAALGLTPRPVLSYQQNVVERIPGVDLAMVQSYWDHEPSAADYATWLSDRAAVLGPFIICGQGHDRRITHGPSPVWTEAALCRLQSRHDEGLRHPDCRGVLWFAFRREGGLVFDPATNDAGPTCHPVELRWVEAICAACEAPAIAPDPAPVPAPEPPKPPEPPEPQTPPPGPEPGPPDVPPVVSPTPIPSGPVQKKQGWIEKWFGGM